MFLIDLSPRQQQHDIKIIDFNSNFSVKQFANNSLTFIHLQQRATHYTISPHHLSYTSSTGLVITTSSMILKTSFPTAPILPILLILLPQGYISKFVIIIQNLYLQGERPRILTRLSPNSSIGSGQFRLKV